MNPKKAPVAILIGLVMILVTASWHCGQSPVATEVAPPTTTKQMTPDEMLERGTYLVHVGGCNDCHSPKMMSPMGPIPDTTRRLSGYPANSPRIPTVGSPTTPGNWVLFGPEITTFVGPWGQSFAANLTPDSATGLGAWTVQNFIETIRKGKHLGQDGGRPLLPPMPWAEFSHMTDEDLASIFTYLQSIPAIHNPVPAPVPPNEIGKK